MTLASLQKALSVDLTTTSGKFVAALGLSVTANVFDTDRDQLSATVMDVAGRASTDHSEPPANASPTGPRRLASVP